MTFEYVLLVPTVSTECKLNGRELQSTGAITSKALSLLSFCLKPEALNNEKTLMLAPVGLSMSFIYKE